MERDLFSNIEWVEDVLNTSDTGLWSVTIDSGTGERKMYGSKSMFRLLGLDEPLSGEECFQHWWGRMSKESQDYVTDSFGKMLSTRNLVEMQYQWNHPTLGEIFIRCTGKVMESKDGQVEVRGYHQNISKIDTVSKESSLSIEEVRRLAKEKRRYEDLFQSVMCGIIQYYMLPSGQIKFKQANQEAIRIFGYDRKEFWKKELWSMADVIHPDDRKALIEKYGTLREVGDRISFEHRMLRRDGTDCWVLGNAEIIQDSDGEQVAQGIFVDIDSQKRLEIRNQMLRRQSEEWKNFLRKALRGTEIFEIYYYPKERVAQIPDEIGRRYGIETYYEDVPNSMLNPPLDPSSREDVAEMYDKVHRGVKTVSCEFAFEGKRTWFRQTLSVIEEDDEGNPSFAVGLVEDISEKRLMERENIELQAIYDFTITHDYECLCILHRESSRYSLRFNGEWRHLDIPLEGEVNEETGEWFRENYGDELASQLLPDQMAEELRENKPTHAIHYVSSDQRHKEIRYSWFGEERQIILITVRDIEEIWRQEEKSKLMLEEALEKAKSASEAKSDFLSRMSHDIRTPLNAVIGMVQIAKKNTYDTWKVEECLEQIESSSQYLYLLVNDILDMSKIENGKMELYEEAFVLDDFIRNIMAVAKPLAEERHHKLNLFDMGIEHHEVRGDYLRLQQVMVNILSNAVKYTNPGGHIEVEVEELSQERPGAGRYRFSVRDNGIGIDKDFLPYLFLPFERKDSKRVEKVEGSGLGMAIAKSIVKMMGGDITVESEQGVGSTFTVFVSLKLQKKGSVGNVAEQEAEIPDFGGRTVLLVEDNMVNREIAAEILAATDAIVDTAENGEEAVRMVRESPEGHYCMVFMDIRMPIMDGYEATEAIRALDREDVGRLPIIAMTADAFAEDVKKAKAHGMTEHLVKPININKLYGIMEQWKDWQDEGA